ncbi:hypothetical protein BU26DRAFT_524962 [Trematosphaeria pertusa]|uniref:Uncharacterized protein n=1 Tax=Trematosphaeria pertusa TaxID=390896 RepID=A0A6A6HUY2_9PLEO|nr:uncharacterized protein BU26DRAFT_524962 [Trematosphaeria pertusa]KAF2241821.1 hypothetical protein BU26DRAFT_524962 [Trematosphaeria pertusa]
MSSKIPRGVLEALAQKVRENPQTLKNLVLSDSTTSVTAVKTQDLRFDVHRNTQKPRHGDQDHSSQQRSTKQCRQEFHQREDRWPQRDSPDNWGQDQVWFGKLLRC